MPRAQSDPERVKSVIDAVNAITEFENRVFQKAVTQERRGTSPDGLNREANARMDTRAALMLDLRQSFEGVLPLAGKKGLTLESLSDLRESVRAVCQELQGWESEWRSTCRSNRQFFQGSNTASGTKKRKKKSATTEPLWDAQDACEIWQKRCDRVMPLLNKLGDLWVALGGLEAASAADGDDGPIPPDRRSKPLTLSKAAALMGYEGSQKSKAAQLKKAINAGAIQCVRLGRQQYVFDLHDFPKASHGKVTLTDPKRP
jgi:hypothetical protein